MKLTNTQRFLAKSAYNITKQPLAGSNHHFNMRLALRKQTLTGSFSGNLVRQRYLVKYEQSTIDQPNIYHAVMLHNANHHFNMWLALSFIELILNLVRQIFFVIDVESTIDLHNIYH